MVLALKKTQSSFFKLLYEYVVFEGSSSLSPPRKINCVPDRLKISSPEMTWIVSFMLVRKLASFDPDATVTSV